MIFVEPKTGTQVTYTPPSSWNVVDSEFVTPENQDQFAIDLGVCGLKSIATQIPIEGLPYPSHAPPIGWVVLTVSRPVGAAEEQLTDLDWIWISPEGKSWSINDCTEAGGAVWRPPEKEVVKPKTTKWLWLTLAAVGGVVLWQVSKDKKKSKRKRKK